MGCRERTHRNTVATHYTQTHTYCPIPGTLDLGVYSVGCEVLICRNIFATHYTHTHTAHSRTILYQVHFIASLGVYGVGCRVRVGRDTFAIHFHTHTLTHTHTPHTLSYTRYTSSKSRCVCRELRGTRLPRTLCYTFLTLTHYTHKYNIPYQVHLIQSLGGNGVGCIIRVCRDTFAMHFSHTHYTLSYTRYT